MTKSLDLIPDYSYLSAYESCARKFYYEHERGLTSPEVNPHLRAGQAVHDGLEVFYKQRDQEAAVDALRSTWDGLTLPPGHDADYLSAGHLEVVLRNYMDAHEDEPRQVVRAFDEIFGERVFVVELDGLQLGGKIDLLEVTDNGRYFLRDFKTSGSWINDYWMSQRKHDLGHQMRLYWAATEAELDITLDGVYIDAIYTGEAAAESDRDWSDQASSPWRLFGPYSYSDAQIEESIAWARQRLIEIERHRGDEAGATSAGHSRAEYAWPQTFDFHCSYCPFYELCTSSPRVRENKIEAKYVERELTGQLASGADSDE